MIGVIACEPAHDASDIPSAVLHESLGFEQVGRLKKVGNKHQKWLDVLLMQKEL
jgi:phosphinothricin acetyltransferase